MADSASPYIVLARKYRPEHFDEVVGQGHVARTLENAIEQDRVAHAYLFTGARGVGKTSTARILAKALNCHEGPRPRPCYACSSCEEISSGQSIDVFEIDGASNRGINEIRELRDGVRYAPNRDRHKIYIIDEVHMLTTEAFNALLKTLEEPPDHVIFIFATTEPQKIPVTILSRCQRFDFKRISQQEIVGHLESLCEQESIDAERTALQMIARQAGGGMRDALSLLDQVISFAGDQIREEQLGQILGVANRKHLFEMSEAIIARDAERALLVLDDIDRYGYDLQQFGAELVHHARDLVVASVVDDPEGVTQLTETELAQARAQIEGQPTELLHRYFHVLVEGAQQMARSPYPKLIFEMTLVRLSQLEPLMSVDLLVDRLQALELDIEAGMSLEDEVKKRLSQPDAALRYQPDALKSARPQTQRSSTNASAPVQNTPTPGADASKASTHKNLQTMTSQPATPSARQGAEEAPQTPEAAQREPTTQGAGARAESPERGAKALPLRSEDPGLRGNDKANNASGSAEAGAQKPPNQTSPAQRPDARQSPAQRAPAQKPVSSPSRSESSAAEEPPMPQDMHQRGPAPGPPPVADGYLDSLGAAGPEGGSAPERGPLLDPAKTAPQEAWRAVVERLRLANAAVAGLCEHAYLELDLEGKVLRAALPQRYYDLLLAEEGRSEQIERSLDRVFGPGWFFELQLREDDDEDYDGEPRTLAQQRDAEIRRRQKVLTDAVRNHPTVQEALETFQTERLHVRVKLEED